MSLSPDGQPLARGRRGKARFLWRELGTAVISPPTGFNRLVFGDEFDAVFPSHKPATFMRLQAGGNNLIEQQERLFSGQRDWSGGRLHIQLRGLPGKHELQLQAPASILLIFISQRSPPMYWKASTLGGCFWGQPMRQENPHEGYGGSMEITTTSPLKSSVSNTTLSLGTTWQTWLSKTVALQGTALAGAGYGAAGKISKRVNVTITTG